MAFNIPFQPRRKPQKHNGQGNIKFSSQREDVLILLSNMWFNVTTPLLVFNFKNNQWLGIEDIEIQDRYLDKYIATQYKGKYMGRYTLKMCIEQYFDAMLAYDEAMRDKDCIELLEGNDWAIEVSFIEDTGFSQKVLLMHKSNTPVQAIIIK